MQVSIRSGVHRTERIDIEFVSNSITVSGFLETESGLVDFTDQRLCRVKMTFDYGSKQLPCKEQTNYTTPCLCGQ